MRRNERARVGNGKETFPVEHLSRLPSIVSEHEKPTLTGKYKFYRTIEVVEALATQGWLPVLAKEQWTKNLAGQGYQKHMIRMRNVNAPVPESLNDVLAELVLTNSHNGLTKYNLYAAFMRLACWNGLLVSQAVFGAIGFRHIGFSLNDVIDASYKVVEGIPEVAGKIQEYQAIELSPVERENLATRALTLRFEAPAIVDRGLAQIGDRSFSIGSLLEPRRELDSKPTLWNTFNILQEKITKGGLYERTSRQVQAYSPRRGHELRVVTRQRVQGIEAIGRDIVFNRALWAVMETIRVEKAGVQVQA